MEALNVELINFLKEETLEPSLIVTEDLSIEDDLGISGDDAYEFMTAFSKRFGVNLVGFDYSDYFNSEPSWLGRSSEKKALTVGMLNRAIEERKF
ncbi:DUF1493 family protein [Olivibacter sp. 47]|uniref:DUF1493 family protein n=1 Tax=Olivibacter sp. 47 TaxID=3056486 RepID=UPI0025A3CCB3|nr:DUF1493 family protein [Olivibacter sp. 47]MDM8178146.1 DUF1493 family protein [Olivibacter sp. 47]